MVGCLISQESAAREQDLLIVALASHESGFAEKIRLARALTREKGFLALLTKYVPSSSTDSVSDCWHGITSVSLIGSITTHVHSWELGSVLP